MESATTTSEAVWPRVRGDTTPLSGVASVIIPAHDEAGSIERCLTSLAADPGSDALDIVVVANGCTDTTAEQARRHAVRCR